MNDTKPLSDLAILANVATVKVKLLLISAINKTSINFDCLSLLDVGCEL